MAEAKGRREAVARVVMPVMATIASALAGYVARKGQQYLEETLMPRLRKRSGAATGSHVPSRAGRPFVKAATESPALRHSIQRSSIPGLPER